MGFTINEVARAIPFYAILGVVFSFGYRLLSFFISLLTAGGKLCLHSMKCMKIRPRELLDEIVTLKYEKNVRAERIVSLICVIILGLIYSLSTYVLLDGVLRIYCLLIVVCTYLICERIVKSKKIRTISRLKIILLRITLFMYTVITYPIRLILKLGVFSYNRIKMCKNNKNLKKCSKNGYC